MIASAGKTKTISNLVSIWPGIETPHLRPAITTIKRVQLANCATLSAITLITSTTTEGQANALDLTHAATIRLTQASRRAANTAEDRSSHRARVRSAAVGIALDQVGKSRLQ